MTEPSKESMAEAEAINVGGYYQREVIRRIAFALDKVRAEEREECAKIADKHGDEEPGMHGYEPAARDIAAAIRNRARGHD